MAEHKNNGCGAEPRRKTYNAIRSLMTRLYRLRCENPHIISGHDFHTLIRAAA